MDKTIAVVDVAKSHSVIIKIVIMTIKDLYIPKHKKLFHLSKANTNFCFSIPQCATIWAEEEYFSRFI